MWLILGRLTGSHVIDEIQQEIVGTRRRMCIWRQRGWTVSDGIGTPVAGNTTDWCAVILRIARAEDSMDFTVACFPAGQGEEMKSSRKSRRCAERSRVTVDAQRG
jgi:hypothetical protein